MSKDLFDAVYGCIIGGAVGDSLGAPTEGMYYNEIRDKYGRLEEMLPNTIYYTNGKPGSVTDDTTLRHYMCYCIVQKGGRITPDDWAQVWIDKINLDRLWANDVMVGQALKWGVSPWESGHAGIQSGCASMAITPIGIINAGNPEKAYHDAMNIAGVNNQRDDRHFAASLAAGNAAAFIPGATIDSVIEAMNSYATDLVKRAMELTMELATTSDTVLEFTKKFYDKLLDWTWTIRPGHWDKNHFFSGHSREFVPVVPALVYLCKEDVNESIIEGANFGRDCDTISSLCGTIAGTLQGASAIRPEWIDIVEQDNADLFEELEGDPKANFRSMSERLVTALQNTRTQMTQECDNLDQVLRQA